MQTANLLGEEEGQKKVFQEKWQRNFLSTQQSETPAPTEPLSALHRLSFRTCTAKPLALWSHTLLTAACQSPAVTKKTWNHPEPTPDALNRAWNWGHKYLPFNKDVATRKLPYQALSASKAKHHLPDETRLRNVSYVGKGPLMDIEGAQKQAGCFRSQQQFPSQSRGPV